MPTKVLVVFHSLYGHIYHLAEAIADGSAVSHREPSAK